MTSHHFYHQPDESLMPNERPEVKRELSEQLAKQVEQWQANGGIIEQVPIGVSGEKDDGVRKRFNFGDLSKEFNCY